MQLQVLRIINPLLVAALYCLLIVGLELDNPPLPTAFRMSRAAYCL